jgi:signal transduction histidine kinase
MNGTIPQVMSQAALSFKNSIITPLYSRFAMKVISESINRENRGTLQRNRRFVVAMLLSCIAALLVSTLLSFGSYLIMSENIRHESSNADIVARSASLSILSQRIALLTLMMLNTTDAHLQRASVQEIGSTLNTMQQSYEMIRTLPKTEETAETRHILTEGDDALAPKLDRFFFEIEQFLKTWRTGDLLKNPHLRPVTEMSAGILAQLADLTRAYRNAGERGIMRLQSLQTGVSVISIAVALILMFAIFRPLMFRLEAELNFRSRVESELRNTSQELKRKSDQLTRSNRELDQFASVIAHDLRGPLHNIQNLGSLLKRSAESHELVAEELITHIQKSSGRMDRMISDLLNFSRSATGQPKLQRVNLNEVIDEITVDLASLLNEANAHLKKESLPTILADRTQMRQLFQNLIQNAIKYRASERALEIRISATTTIENSDEQSIEISVKDNGIGFKSEESERVFEIFHRLNSEDDQEGIGLGLAICRRIARLHGGEITAQGIPKLGATFTVRLPG